MATFGKTTDGSTVITSSLADIHVSQATPASNGRLTSITARIWATSTAAQARGVVFTDISGAPGILYAYTNDVLISNTSEAENVFLFPDSQRLYIISGTPYWLGVHFSAQAGLNLSKDNTANMRQTKPVADTFSDGTYISWVSNSSQLTPFSGPIDVYATYDTVGRGELIKSQIVSILQANITNANVVYSYVERNPSGYPSILVEYYDGQGEFADTGRNRRSRIYRITCMQERVKVGASESERILGAMVDQILGVFDNRTNITLNGSCEFAQPIPSKWGYIQAPDIDVRTAEILLEAVSLE